jgi:hypothetical protein
MSVQGGKAPLWWRGLRKVKRLLLLPLRLWRMQGQLLDRSLELQAAQEVLWQRVQRHLWDIQEQHLRLQTDLLRQVRDVQACQQAQVDSQRAQAEHQRAQAECGQALAQEHRALLQGQSTALAEGLVKLRTADDLLMQTLLPVVQASAHLLETQQLQCQEDVQRHTHLLRHLSAVAEGLELVLAAHGGRPAPAEPASGPCLARAA